MKKGILWALAIFFLFGAFAVAEETPRTAVALNFEDAAALIAPDGRVLAAPGEYDTIFSVDMDAAGERFAAGGMVDGQILYALLDASGEPLTEQAYEMFMCENGYVLFLQNERYGAMTWDGEELFSAQFTSLVTNGQDGFLATTTDCWDDEPDGLYSVDRTGKASATGVKTLGPVGTFSEGMMSLLSAENYKYGFVDVDGQWAIRPQFEYAENFLDGRACAQLTTGLGMIDRTGNWALTPKYDSISREEGGKFVLAVENQSVCLALDAQTLSERFRVTGENLYASCMGQTVQVYAADGVSLYAADGACIYQGSEDTGFAGGENGQTVVYEGEWGAACVYLLARDGSVVCGPYQQLASLGTFGDTAYYTYMTFPVAENFSAELNQTVYDWDLESVRYGMIDQQGNEVLPAEYTALYRLSDDCLYFERDGVAGAMDATGRLLYSIETN